MKRSNILEYKLRMLALGLVALFALAASAQAEAVMSSPSLPPIGNDVNGLPTGYLSPSDVHAMFSGPGLAVVLTQVQHKPFALLERLPQPDGSEIETFQSTLDGLASVNGAPPFPFHAEGPVTTRVNYPAGGGGPLGTFPTEMLSMSLTGPGSVMIRESPTLQSTGQTSVQSVPSGFQIDSFFDVFTELSVDGGLSWIPNDGGPTHVDLQAVPEPGTAALLAIGAAGLIAVRLRRRS